MKVTFTIEYYTLWGEGIALEIGGRRHPMEWAGNGQWRVTVNVAATALNSYGYVLVKDGLIERMEWKNHSAKVPSGTKETEIRDSWIDCPIPGCPFVREHQASEFDRPGFRSAGVAVPVFSLRSKNDFGIGEFLDLKPLADWASKVGMRIIQLLPVTDSTRCGTWKDSYPYSPVSSFALHPLYVNLQRIGVKDTPSFRKKQKELNALPEVDYPRVFKEKMSLIRKAFAALGAEDMQSASFRKFCKAFNPVWLTEYAEFCAKRDGDSPDFWRWIQWHLDVQFREAADYARSKGVHLKGDLPIGVSADSADAFWHPELFNLDSSAGAPPDFFSADGQCWGFPTYNWDAMAKDDYAWWKARLKHMSRYFDAFRIDHILGFFRIWEIPVEISRGLAGHFNPALPYSGESITSMGLPLQGLFLPDPRNAGCWQPMIVPSGEVLDSLEPWQKERYDALHTDFFYHRNDAFWRRNAMRKLPQLLSASGMLACGEDLGMVPDCVGGVMSQLGILSLEMKMADKGRPWPALAVCATSSHDSATLRMQWGEEHGGEDMPSSEVMKFLALHINSAPMLAIFPLQDWMALDEGIRRADFMNERINEPANADHHWRWRVHVNLENLIREERLNVMIRELLSQGRRL